MLSDSQKRSAIQNFNGRLYADTTWKRIIIKDTESAPPGRDIWLGMVSHSEKFSPLIFMRLGLITLEFDPEVDSLEGKLHRDNLRLREDNLRALEESVQRELGFPVTVKDNGSYTIPTFFVGLYLK